MSGYKTRYKTESEKEAKIRISGYNVIPRWKPIKIMFANVDVNRSAHNLNRKPGICDPLILLFMPRIE